MRRHASGMGCGARGPVSQTGTREARVTVRSHYGEPPFGGLNGTGRRRRKPLDRKGEESSVRVPEATVPAPKIPR